MRKKLYSNILKVLLLTIFYGYVGVSIFYSHIHIVNGKAIFQIHIFGETAEDQPFHTHTQSEFQLLHSLAFHNTASDIIPSFVFCASSKLIVTNKTTPICKGFATILQTDFSRRGPPSIFS